MARTAIRPRFPAENRNLSAPKKAFYSPLRPDDRGTAKLCGESFTRTAQFVAPRVILRAAHRGAEFAYHKRIWRVELLVDDAENRNLSAPKKAFYSPLHPGDRGTAKLCGESFARTAQFLPSRVIFRAAHRGAEFAYHNRIWRVEFLVDDGQISCCYRNLCDAAGGAA